MPEGQLPDLDISLKDKDGKLHKISAVWKQNKGHFTDKLKLTDDLVKLLEERQETPIYAFPTKPKGATKVAADQQPAA